MQEALVRAYRFWGARTGADPWPWLRRMVVRECLRLGGRQTADRRRDEAVSRRAAPAPPTPEEAVILAEERVLVRAALARLPAGYRTVLRCCHEGGLTLDEAAAVLGLPPGTVRWRYKRAHDHLRRVLSGARASALSETLREVAIRMEIRVTVGDPDEPQSPVLEETWIGRLETDWDGLARAVPRFALPAAVREAYPDLRPWLLGDAPHEGGRPEGPLTGVEICTPEEPPRLLIDHSPADGGPVGRVTHHLGGREPLSADEETQVGGHAGRWAQVGAMRHVFWRSAAGAWHVGGTLPAAEIRRIAEALAAAE